jgi:hypothetical protein
LSDIVFRRLRLVGNLRLDFDDPVFIKLENL